jgi:hypothetical protein
MTAKSVLPGAALLPLPPPPGGAAPRNLRLGAPSEWRPPPAWAALLLPLPVQAPPVPADDGEAGPALPHNPEAGSSDAAAALRFLCDTPPGAGGAPWAP